MSVVRVARPRAIVLLVAGALLFASLGVVRPAEAAGSASISGVITDGDDQPIAGATVKVERIDGDDYAESSTDGDGRFVASGLSAGRYAVCFYLDKALLECWEDIEPSLPRYTPIEVADGEQVVGIDAVLEPSYLRGTVTDKRGAPVEGAWVSQTWYTPGGGRMISDPTVTDADGSFEIGPLFSGEYTLRFSDNRLNRYVTEWWDDAPTEEAAKHVQLAREESVEGLDAVLDDLPHITGQVKGADGTSARGAQVRAFRVLTQTTFEADSSPVAADGSYDLGGLQPGTYRLKFDAAPGKYRSEYWKNARGIPAARNVVISGTTPVTGVDAVLRLAPPVLATQEPSIKGRARVGQPLRVDNGTWDVGPLRFAYQWRADGVAIPGATERSLWPGPRLLGKHISVRVRVTAVDRERSPGLVVARRTQPIAGR